YTTLFRSGMPPLVVAPKQALGVIRRAEDLSRVAGIRVRDLERLLVTRAESERRGKGGIPDQVSNHGERLLEARGKSEREGAQRREVERVGLIDESRDRAAIRRARAAVRAKLGIVTRVFGEGRQVATHQADRPIAPDAAHAP